MPRKAGQSGFPKPLSYEVLGILHLWMLHTCHFCITLKSSTIEEEVEFFQGRIEAEATLPELVSLRSHYHPVIQIREGLLRNNRQAVLRDSQRGRIPDLD